jgi:ATP-dependent Clp protease ATP-binding subunit ClpB
MSIKRLDELEGKISELEKEFADLDEIWKAEKAAVQGSAHIKETLEQVKTELETARRAGAFNF